MTITGDVLDEEPFNGGRIILTDEHRVHVVKDGSVTTSTDMIEDEDEAYEQFHTAIENYTFDPLHDAAEYMQEKGFEVVDMTEHLAVVKRDGMQFAVNPDMVEDERYRFIPRHWDRITNIVDSLEPPVSRDMIENAVVDEMPYAKEASQTTVTDTVTMILS